MGDNDRQDANRVDDQAEESDEQRAETRRVERAPESPSAPAPGDDIIIK